MLGVDLVVYRGLTEADFRKFAAESNDSDTGGGARDLRFRPYDKFDSVFEELFPGVGTVVRKRDGQRASVAVRLGKFYWIDGFSGQRQSRETRFEPPTTVRPNEGRLTKVHNYPSLAGVAFDAADRSVFLMAKDTDGLVWPYIVRESSLRSGDWDQSVAEAIIKCLSVNRTSTAQGYLRPQTKMGFCNG